MRLVKSKEGLIPYTDDDKIDYDRLSVGDIVKCSIIDPRNAKHHRKFFALIKVVYENLPEEFDRHFPTKDDLRYELIRRAGFYKEYKDLKGNTQYRPDSIAWDSMGQKKFEELYDKVLDVVVKWFLWDKETLEDEIMHFA